MVVAVEKQMLKLIQDLFVFTSLYLHSFNSIFVCLSFHRIGLPHHRHRHRHVQQ